MYLFPDDDKDCDLPADSEDRFAKQTCMAKEQ